MLVDSLNPNIKHLPEDILYHLSLGTESHDLEEMFGDVRYVCMGGSPKRMRQFAEYMLKELGYVLPTGTSLVDISSKSDRYEMYKVGPVLSISHGMGIPSASILLHEVIKLMFYAKVMDPVFFRIGTCGGVGIPPGSVVVTEEALDGRLRPFLEMVIMGEVVHRPAELDEGVANTLLTMSREDDGFVTVKGKTVATDDFYEGQGRLDGAFCDYTPGEKMNFLRKLSHHGVVNMEMEATAFAALTKKAGIRAAIVCVAIVDRLNGDQITASKDQLVAWQERPQQIVSRFILSDLNYESIRESRLTMRQVSSSESIGKSSKGRINSF